MKRTLLAGTEIRKCCVEIIQKGIHVSTYINLEQAAHFLDVHIPVLEKFIQLGILPLHAENGEMFISKEHLQEFKRQRETARSHVEHVLIGKKPQISLTPDEMVELDNL